MRSRALEEAEVVASAWAEPSVSFSGCEIPIVSESVFPSRRYTVCSMPAAVAVEAAAQQGQYEAMYHRMYETQPEWGESAEDKSAVFRGFAEDLGLDMAAYDAAVADPVTEARVRLDVADGTALGVRGTPTFFLDGQPLTPDSLEQFRAAVDAAAAD